MFWDEKIRVVKVVRTILWIGAAKMTKAAKNEVIGIIMNNISGMDYQPVIKGLQFANQAGYTLIFSNSYQSPEFEELLDQINGLIIISSHTKEKLRIRQLIDREIPLVLVESYLSDTRANCIRVDNVEGGYIATRHLLGLGHTRIVHITGDLNYQVLFDRMEGYRKALCESKLPPRPDLIITRNYSEEDGYLAMKRLLAYKSDFTAVFTANDKIALGVLQAIDEAGLSVPDDISVVGYDDSEFSKNINPPLTTVRQPRFEMGERAMAILNAIFQNHLAMNEGMKICFMPELVIRGTTSCFWNSSDSLIALGTR
jgi:LacI family transcriptional regulator